MILRRLALPALLTAAVGMPMMLHKGGIDSIKQRFASFGKQDEAPSDTPWPPSRRSDVRQLVDVPRSEFATSSDSVPIVGAPVSDLTEVLRFNVTRQWVMRRWPRVTTTLANLDLEGLRVPLVTGTGAHDLAGSLTYYFDKQQVVQRITFYGFTADESQLVKLITEKCGLRAEPTLGRGLYLAKWGGKPRSALIVRHASIVRSTQPMTQLEVKLELNRPRRGYRLSKRFDMLLVEKHNAGQW